MLLTQTRLPTLVLLWAPLAVMPFLLTLRWDAMVAPNEEPKWFVLVVFGLILAIAGCFHTHLSCRARPETRNSVQKTGLTFPGFLFTVFFLGIALGVTYATNVQDGIIRFAFWCSGGLTFWAISLASREGANYLHRLQATLSLSALLLCLFFWWGFLVDFKDPNFDKFASFSRIGHFNFTADVLMVLIPTLTWTVITQRSRIIRLGAGFSLASSLFMLLMSGSLGGMGGLLGGGLVSLGLYLSPRRRSNPPSGQARPRSKRYLLFASVALVTCLVGRWAYMEMPKEYREQIFVRGTWWEAPKPESLTNAKAPPPIASFWFAILPYLGSRTPMWAATTGMVTARPWLGFGTGSYLTEYPNFSKRYDLFGDYETFGVKIKTNPHNILLQLASENGIPLALLFVGLYVWLSARVLLKAWREPSALWLCGAWMICALGLDAQVNHIFFNPASLFMAAVGLGLLYGQLERESATALMLPVCPLWRSPLMPLLITLIATFVASVPLRWIISEHYVAEASRPGTSSLSRSPIFQRLAWETALKWFPSNVQAIFGMAVLDLEQGRTTDAETKLLQFLALYPHHSYALNLLATLQAGSGRLDEAEQNLLKSMRLEPDSVTVRENLDVVRKAKEEGQKTGPSPSDNPPSAPDR